MSCSLGTNLPSPPALLVWSIWTPLWWHCGNRLCPCPTCALSTDTWISAAVCQQKQKTSRSDHTSLVLILKSPFTKRGHQLTSDAICPNILICVYIISINAGMFDCWLYLSRCFQLVWFLPQGLFGLCIVVICPAIWGLMLSPLCFLVWNLQYWNTHMGINGNRINASKQRQFKWTRKQRLHLNKLCIIYPILMIKQ